MAVDPEQATLPRWRIYKWKKIKKIEKKTIIISIASNSHCIERIAQHAILFKALIAFSLRISDGGGAPNSSEAWTFCFKNGLGDQRHWTDKKTLNETAAAAETTRRRIKYRFNNIADHIVQ